MPPSNAINELPEICRLDELTAQVVSESWHPPDATTEDRQGRDQLLRSLESRKEGGDASSVRQTGHIGERRSGGCDVGDSHSGLGTRLELATDEHTLWDDGFLSQLKHAAAPVPDPFQDPLPGPFLDPPGSGFLGPCDREQTTSTHSAPPLASVNGLCDGRIFVPAPLPPDF